MRKKILVVAPYSAHTKKFIEMIAEEYSVILLTNKEIIFDSIVNVKIVLIKQNKLLKILQLKQLIIEHKPLFIHFHNLSKMNIFYSFFVRRYNTIITTWGSDILITPKQNIINFYLTKLSLFNFKIISTNNAIIMQSALKFLTNKTLYPIHFGVNKYIKFIDFGNKKNIIYSPRSHRDLYNIKNIIYSFAEFMKNNSEDSWRLVLSGREDKVNTPYYKKLCKELNISQVVDFIGFIDDKANSLYFKQAKIVVSIPDSDAKSVTAMEAISSNCLCILSDIPSNREFVINGINGFIVNHHKIIDFSIYKTIDIQMMTKCNETISKNFSYQNAQQSFLDLYKI